MGCLNVPMLALLTCIMISQTTSEILNPPYFNLAEGSSISATATCGVNSTDPKELFCRLTGASADERQEILNANLYLAGNSQIIMGQLCDYCAAPDVQGALSSQVHSAEYAIDGTERWWQSPPLSRSSSFNQVNLTVDLGQEFQVAYVFIKMGNSPRPGVWALERSVDFGKTWSTWQYFADSAADCMLNFGVEAASKPTKDDSVICTTEFSKIVPLEGGEIAVSLVQDRPGAENFSQSPELQQFTRATNIRLSLLRTKTLLGHLMLLQRQDPTVTRRYFYSIKDITIGGRCVCNGHSDVCDKKDAFKLVCECQHNTCGDQCDQCCEPFVQKKWRKATDENPNECEPCQCFGHTDKCVYDEEVDNLGISLDIHGNYEGGGVCLDCQDNTMGTNCDKCVPGYYRPRGRSLYDRDVCEACVCDPYYTTGDCEDETGICYCKEQFTGPDCKDCAFGYYGPDCKPCDCFINGTQDGICEVGGGQCPCFVNFGGPRCDECAPGFWNFPDCIECTCNGVGPIDNVCDQETGQCPCGFAFTGLECDSCQSGHYSYPDCNWCDCDATGTIDTICDVNSGQCICKENYAGERCDRCAPGFFSYPDCLPCECDSSATVGGSVTCNDQGQCQCQYNFGGKKCSACSPGFYDYPSCKDCQCDRSGSFGQSCDQASAQCDCRPNYTGLKCDSCAPDFYNHPTCEPCLCNPAGAVPVPGYPLGGCGSFDDGYTLCECKENVEGHTCDQCKPGFYGLRREYDEGCIGCNCHLPGTLLADNMCDPVTGQCVCKVNVNSDKCQECLPGTYNLQESSVFGCQDCNCDVGGAVRDFCDADSGQCVCRNRVTGRTCSKPLKNHYFPTLHQFKYELEDGYNPHDDDSTVRFGFDEAAFPDFSWRGYAVFSRVQTEIRITIDVDKPSVFRLIFRYMNRNLETVNADVLVTPDDPQQDEQVDMLSFPPTEEPDFLTTDTSFVLNPARWTVTLKTERDLDVDYMVLLPQAYYEAAILQDRLRNPCMIPSSGEECLHYTYVDLSKYSHQDGGDAMRPDGESTKLETNRDYLFPLDSPSLALLQTNQPELLFNITLPKPGSYVYVINYLSDMAMRQEVTITVMPEGENSTMSKASLYECLYSSLCRQVVIDMEGGADAIFSPTTNVQVKISRSDNDTYGSIGSVIAIPEDEWVDRLLRPEIMCVRVGGKCIESKYSNHPDAIKVEAEIKTNTSDVTPSTASDKTGLVKLSTDAAVMVPFSGLESDTYAIIVSYYQPNDLGFPINVSVDVNGVMYTGFFDADYCPSTAGCNSIIQFDDILIKNHNLDVLSSDLTVNILPLEKDIDVWVDFLQMMPEMRLDELQALTSTLAPYDLSGRFISECTGDNFYIDAERGQISPFCRSSIFSVTTEYNNGVLECGCDAEGSVSFQCSEFGGQCRCKENVIGRTCNACAQNYFGFPDCKPCNCPATCNAQTGECECPKRVIGPLCDQCAPQTFGYDATIGCMDCNCKPEGVLGGNLDCDLDIGSCDCKPNVDGRKCDTCINGYWNYPVCEECDCDPAGTLEGICDKDTSRCRCKDNTAGASCGECLSGTFNLEARNPVGCTKCFCFGITSSCTSSTLLRVTVQNMTGWGIMNVNGTVNVYGDDISVSASVNASTPVDPSQPMYWLAPVEYLGNKLTSYGGQLKYTVMNFGIGRGDRPNIPQVKGADVKMTGSGRTLVYSLLSPIIDEEIGIEFLESFWNQEGTNAPVTREQLMTVLASVDELLIKANYYEGVPEITLMSVSLDVAEDAEDLGNTTTAAGASRSFSSDVALTVEHCACPPNYEGTSCENCAEGFYRQKNAQGQFICVPCECNGHSNTCDRETGICMDCQGYTTGDHCDKCQVGYTGDPRFGDCLICACPMPIESNNFAIGCELSLLDNTNTVSCDCLPGYLAPFCDECSAGYYGNPRDISGGGCRPCQCNGNIDPLNPDSCDKELGGCLICLNNTQGGDCGECADMHWGDAVDNKNCTKCDCDEVGTDSCDKETGQCMCRPNVIGDRCDQCAPDTWGFESGNGCSHCNCSIAANSSQCDSITGKCMCQPGVHGKLCSSCLPQHWDFGADGCKKCECELEGAVGCNVNTGVCDCLFGVTGERCDRCENRWVLIPEQGCEPCDNCVHTLLDDTDGLQFDIANASASLYIINIGVEARKRLEKLNHTAAMLRDRLANVPKKDLVEDERDRLKTEMEQLQALAASAVRESLSVETMAGKTTSSYLELREKLERTNRNKSAAIEDVNEILQYIKNKYQDVVNSTELVNADNLLQQAQDLLDSMNERSMKLNNTQEDADRVKMEADNTMNDVLDWQSKTSNLNDRFESISDALNDTASRLNDLLEKAEDAVSQSNITDELLKKVRAMIEELLKNTKNMKSTKLQIEKTLKDANDLANQATEFVTNATEEYQRLENDLTVLEGLVSDLNSFYDQLVVDNEEVTPTVRNATEHAMKLRERADNLESLLRDTKEASAAAIKAANAYQMIVESINTALNASQNALGAALEAIQQSTDIQNNTAMVREDSASLLTEAELAKNETSTELRSKLNNSISTLSGLDQRIFDIEQNVANAEFQINLVEYDHKKRAEAANQSAADSLEETNQAIDSVKPILNVLSADLGKAKIIPTIQDQMGVTLLKVQTQVDTINNSMPNVTNLTEHLFAMKKPALEKARINLNNSIAALRSKIDAARATANRIKVAMKSNENTSVELRMPENFPNIVSEETTLGLFFQTEQPGGLLLYVGPKYTEALRMKRAVGTVVEFLALELVDGYVVWKFNLGSNTVEVRSNKTYNDGKWHQVIARRTAGDGSLVVKTQNGDRVMTDETRSDMSSSFISLNLNEAATKIYAAGVPDNFTLPPQVESRRFLGGLDDITYSESKIPLGLWNFASGQANNEGILDRGDELAKEVETAVGFVAEKESYVEISAGSLNAENILQVDLNFKTLYKDGLLFFVGEDKSNGSVSGADYAKIYIKDGRPHASVNLGSGEITVSLDTIVSDNTPRFLQLYRRENSLALTLDSSRPLVVHGDGNSKGLNLGKEPRLFIGGIPKDSPYSGASVANHPYFDGCVNDLSINQQPKSIATNFKSKVNTVPGCKLIKRRLTFREPQPNPRTMESYAHIMRDVISVGEDFQVGMRIKTLADEGLLFFASSEDETHAFSLALDDGYIVVKNTAGKDGDGGLRSNSVQTSLKYNDGKWHSIRVEKAALNLTIIVDDANNSNKLGTHKGRKTRTSPGFGYFLGGLSQGVRVHLFNMDNSPTWKNYIGCMSHVSILNVMVDFAENPPTGDNVDYSVCPIPDPVETTYSPTTSTDATESDQTTDSDIGKLTSDAPSECELPVRPNMKGATEQGTRFGLTEDSRLEYESFAGIQTEIKKQVRLHNHVRLRIKTTAKNGMVWFIGSTKSDNPDYTTLYIKDGFAVYQCQLGGGSATARSANQINDGEWHTLELNRTAIKIEGQTTREAYGSLTTDGEIDTVKFPAGGTSLNIALPIYIGGIDMADMRYSYMAAKIGAGSASSLVGCIDKIQYREKGDAEFVDYGTPQKSFSTQACFNNQEDGAFIPEGEGSLAVSDNIGVGKDKELQLSVRPRSNTGVLAVIYGGGDYLGIELFDGKVIVNMNNGAGDIEAFKDAPDICDGQWRTIKVVKSGHIVELHVSLAGRKDPSPARQVGSAAKTGAEVSSPFYIGGMPDEANVAPYKPKSGQLEYVGCIRGVSVGDLDFNLSRARKIGLVEMTCPTM